MNYILVTGASSGVGRQLAIYLSREYKLILNGRNEEQLKKTKDMCYGDPILWPFDLAQIKDIEVALTEFIRENDIKISSFVHCAGIMKMLPVRVLDADSFNKIFAVNVFAPALITKALAAKKNNDKELKSVVFISSNISERGAAAFSVYGSSKAALDGLMRNLAIELAPNVRVNSVLPGGMITEMTKEIFADEDKRVEIDKKYPLGIGTPENIAPMVEFLISDKAKWITGQQFTVDGGRTIDITERSK